MTDLDARPFLRVNFVLVVRTAVIILNVVSATACAPIGAIKIEVSDVAEQRVYLLDARPPRYSLFSWDYLGAGVGAYRLPDSDFEPDPMTVVSRIFQAKLSERLQGKTVIVMQFLVSLVDVGAGDQVAHSPGEALGLAVIDFAKRSGYGWMIFCEFETSVDGKVFKATETTRTEKAKVEEGVNKVIRKTLDTAARAMNAHFAYQF